MSERTNIQVRHGDWLVFHVANNRLRWGGSYYFAAAGLFEKASALSLGEVIDWASTRAACRSDPAS